MKIYLDMCCFNRPFDEQSQSRIYIETEAKLIIQQRTREGKLGLIWSFMLDYENSANPDDDVRASIAKWREIASTLVGPTPEITAQANGFHALGLGIKDSLHLACAISGMADCFLTVDKGILKRKTMVNGITIMNPIDFFQQED
jgi:hypothetical protein